jgi:hypothetical protein
MSRAMARQPRTLLAPGNEAAWARINEEERRSLWPPADTPVATLLRQGMALSQQAILLLNAIEPADEDRSAPAA